MSQTVKIEGMKCEGCANAVKNKFSNVEGVSSVIINLEKKEATLESSKEYTNHELNEALSDTPYSVAE